MASAGERWLPIPSYPSYEISSLGRIRRVVRLDSKKLGKTLSQYQNDGYMQVILSESGVKKLLGVHRLLCYAFHGDPPSPRHEAAHANGIRNDNREENLGWLLPKDNNLDKMKHGTLIRGSDHYRSKLDDGDVVDMRNMFSSGRSATSIAKAYGVCDATAVAAIRGRTWSHIPGAIPVAKMEK